MYTKYSTSHHDLIVVILYSAGPRARTLAVVCSGVLIPCTDVILDRFLTMHMHQFSKESSKQNYCVYRRSMRSMRYVLFSAIEGPLSQRWYALPPAPRILAFCQIHTVMEGRHPRPRTLTYDKTSGSTNGLRSISETVPNKHPMMNTDCGA